GCDRVAASAELGRPAPDFSLKALDGTTHTLAQYRGETVVLEWFNPGCPFIRDTHRAGGALDGAAAARAADGVVWLAINSGAAGKEGADPADNVAAAAAWSLAHPILLDPDGAVGHRYGAVSTPHLFVIDPTGVLVYRGAIDNRPLGKGDGLRVDYVARALDDVKAGRKVATPETKPYG
ncbi:MAG: redoxin domain-containing protein, partial [Myxococcota bacterium]